MSNARKNRLLTVKITVDEFIFSPDSGFVDFAHGVNCFMERVLLTGPILFKLPEGTN